MYTNPEVNLISTYHPGGLDVAFTDPEWGATTARQALDNGADIIFGAGGQTGNGALIEVAKEGGCGAVRRRRHRPVGDRPRGPSVPDHERHEAHRPGRRRPRGGGPGRLHRTGATSSARSAWPTSTTSPTACRPRCRRRSTRSRRASCPARSRPATRRKARHHVTGRRGAADSAAPRRVSTVRLTSGVLPCDCPSGPRTSSCRSPRSSSPCSSARCSIWLDGSNPWTAYTALIDGALGDKDALARTLGEGDADHVHRTRRHRRHEGRPVQHRRPGPAAVRCRVRGVGRLPVHRPAGGRARAVRPPRRRHLRHAAGGARRLPQGLPGGARGDHDDHAQRHPRQHDRVPRRRPWPVPRPRRRRHLPDAGDPGLGGDPRGLGPPDRLVPRRHRRRRHLVARARGRRSASGSRRSARTRTPPSTAASRPPTSPCWRWPSAGSSPASAAPIETQGVFGRYEAGFNVGLGFDGITVALLARVQPLLAIPAALLLGIMRAGRDDDGVRGGCRPGDHRRDPGRSSCCSSARRSSCAGSCASAGHATKRRRCS